MIYNNMRSLLLLFLCLATTLAATPSKQCELSSNRCVLSDFQPANSDRKCGPGNTEDDPSLKDCNALEVCVGPSDDEKEKYLCNLVTDANPKCPNGKVLKENPADPTKPCCDADGNNCEASNYVCEAGTTEEGTAASGTCKTWAKPCKKADNTCVAKILIPGTIEKACVEWRDAQYCVADGGAIAGISAGAVVFIILVAYVVTMMMAKKKNAAVDTSYTEVSQYRASKKFRNRRSNIRQVFKDHP